MTRWRTIWAFAIWAGIGMMGAADAYAFSIELKRAAPGRIEQQRAYTLQPAEKANVPPQENAIANRLKNLGVESGAPAFIRIFKSESSLELWLFKNDRYVLYERFPICFWSGKLGPKAHEGDGQAPEGFYTITRRQLHWSARWARSLNIGYPNRLDRRHGRTGSHILIHGGCSSVGCYSMTNRAMSEIHYIVRLALRRAQSHVQVHIFPFRMTDENLAAHATSPWHGFWQELKPAYDLFEKSRRPASIAICGKHYKVKPSRAHAGEVGPIRVLHHGRRARTTPWHRYFSCMPVEKETAGNPATSRNSPKTAL